MLYEIYTWEKMRELEREGRARLPGRKARTGAAALRPRLARAVGTVLRRLGAGLEDWGETASPGGCCETCG